MQVRPMVSSPKPQLSETTYWELGYVSCSDLRDVALTRCCRRTALQNWVTSLSLPAIIHPSCLHLPMISRSLDWSEKTFPLVDTVSLHNSRACQKNWLYTRWLLPFRQLRGLSLTNTVEPLWPEELELIGWYFDTRNPQRSLVCPALIRKFGHCTWIFL